MAVLSRPEGAPLTDQERLSNAGRLSPYSGGDSNIDASDPKYYPTEQTQTIAPSTSTSTSSREPTYGTNYNYSTSTAIPTMPRPQMGPMPQYDMPEYDQERVKELREISMSVPMSRLQRALNRTMMETRYAGNKAVRASMTRESLAGYGEGVSNIGLAAQKEAISQYAPEYGAEREKAVATYAANLDRYKTQFASDMNEYLATMKRTQSTSGSSTTSGGGTTTSQSTSGGTSTVRQTYSLNPTYATAKGA